MRTRRCEFRGGFRGGGFHYWPEVWLSILVWYGSPPLRVRLLRQYVFGDSVAAASQGYHDGLKTGEDDAPQGRSFDPERSHYSKTPASVTLHKHTVTDSSVDTTRDFAVKS